MEFRVLGPLRIYDGRQWVCLANSRQQRLLAALLLSANEVVTLSRLVDAVWDDDPPATAKRQVQNSISAVRRTTAAPVIVADGPGYRIEVAAGQLDAQVFAERVAHAAKLEPVAAVELLRSALGLWHGPALAGINGRLVEAAAARLDEQRLAATELCVELELGLGRHRELLGELGELVATWPLRERPVAQLMLALYRSGRQAEALAAYGRLCGRLADELGVDPGGSLRELESAILRQDPDLDWIPPSQPVSILGEQTAPAPVPAELPADMATFTGRAAPLAELDAVLAGGPTPAVVISAISGAAGVGKTALAVHWGHRVRPRFPDGQLYVNLHGYAPGPPVRPIEALARFLRALGVPASLVPIDVEEAASRYRSLLADRRILVVLDNAASAEQVRPLLPASPGCLVVVTSRDRLAGLIVRDGAVRLALDVLTAEEALALLARVVGEDRVRSESAAAAELTRLCAGLPLALRIAAANLTQGPFRSITDYLAELRAGNRLAALQVDDDEQSAVRNAFDLSYTRLAGETRRLFRLLGLVPGADFTAEVSAALSDITTEQAKRLLDRLSGAHLIEQHTQGRYAFHDLLRLYATECANNEDTEAARRAALTRMFDYYRDATAAAMDGAFPGHRQGLPGVSAPATPTRRAVAAQARAWLDAERANLVAVTSHAARQVWPEHACDLATALGPYVIGGHYTDAITISRDALHAARSREDCAAEGDALSNLGAVYWRTGRPEEATAHLVRALAIRRQIGDRAGEGRTLHHLGGVSWHYGRYRRTFDYCRQALEISRSVGDLYGETTMLNNLSMVHWRWRRPQEAHDHAEQALAVARRIGDRHNEACALDNLCMVYEQWGRYPQALDHGKQALAIAREIGHRGYEAEAVRHLGLAHLRSGRPQEALDHAEQALAIASTIGDRHREALALNSLGEILRATGNPDDGVTHHRSALVLARATHNRNEQARSLDGIAHAEHAGGHTADAHRHWREALAIYTDLCVPEADEIHAHLRAC